MKLQNYEFTQEVDRITSELSPIAADVQIIYQINEAFQDEADSIVQKSLNDPACDELGDSKYAEDLEELIKDYLRNLRRHLRHYDRGDTSAVRALVDGLCSIKEVK